MNITDKLNNFITFAKRSGWKTMGERQGKFVEFITPMGLMITARIDEKNDLVIQQQDHIRIDGEPRV